MSSEGWSPSNVASSDATGRAIQTPDDRAVSPVVGVVLLVAVTILLALVAAPMIFGFAADSEDETPNAEFAFHYSEATDDVGLDAFDRAGGDTAEAGLVTVTYERGDPLPADRVRIETGTGTYTLSEMDEYGPGDTVRQGERFGLWSQRGAKLSIIWESADRESSSILDSFEIAAPELLPPNVPSADFDCEWVADNVEGGDFVVAEGEDFESGDVVKCEHFDDIVDGEVDIDGHLTLIAPIDTREAIGLELPTVYASVFGDVATEDELDLDTATVEGDVEALGGVDLADTSGIAGDVESGDTVGLDGGSTVDGSVDAEDDVDIQNDGRVGGSITSGDRVDLDGGSAVEGNIDADGVVDIQNDGQVGGSITSGDSVDLDGGSAVEGSIDADGVVQVDNDGTVGGSITTPAGADIQSGATVHGDVTTEGTTDITDGAVVHGDVVVDGDLSLSGVTVHGEVTVTGQFDCQGSQIDGRWCDQYKSPEHVVTIESTDSPVTEGETVEVETTIENVGFGGNEPVTLAVDGTQVDQEDIHIGRNQQTTETFTWETHPGDEGTYTAVVSSQDHSDTTTVTVSQQGAPSFGVTIDDHDDEIPAGSQAEVVATVENSGDATGTQTVELRDFDGTVVDSTDRTLQSGESDQVTLTWDTDPDDVGSDEVTVTSEDDSTDRQLTVEAVVYDIENVLLTDSQGNDMEVLVTLETNDDDAEIDVYNDHDSTTVPVDSEQTEYTVTLGGANQVDSVTVDLFDQTDTLRDSETEPW